MLDADSHSRAWDIWPGEHIRRTELHRRFGGGGQGGISPSARTPNVLIFTDRSAGEQHGYLDRWEGTTLHYTGEGQRGSQTMDRGNRAILDHVDRGRTLRVFEGVRGTVTYSGEFTLDPIEPYYVARAPETGGGPLRDVFMFKLVPVGQFAISESLFEPADIAPTMGREYMDADEAVATNPGETRVPDADFYDRGLRGHRVTQNALARWVELQGHEPLSPALGDPPFDLAWWDDQVFVVAEVKSLTPSNEMGQIRLGLGQILEYVHRIERHHDQVRGVLAVESKPIDPIWKDLCADHGVQLVWPPFEGS